MNDLSDRGRDLSADRRMLLELLRRERRQPEAAVEVEPAAPRDGTVPTIPPFGLVAEADRALLPDGLEDAYPLTRMQAGMMFHMELSPDYPLYHNVDSWHLKARFSAEPFQAAVDRVVGRHAVLRTSFDLATYSEPMQLVHPRARLEVGVEDLRHLSAPEQAAVVDRFVDAEKRRRFDLTKPPLLRFFVHVRSEQSFQFTITEFHPILDGWSLQSTLTEILRDYAATLRGGPPPEVPPLAASFRDFVYLEQQALRSEEARRFWEEILAGASVLRLPRWPAPFRERGGAPFRTFRVPLDPGLFEKVRELSRGLGVPLKSLFLAAHGKVLGHVSGQGDVLTGLIVHGRPEGADGDQVRGLFLNTVPVRLDVTSGTWAELVRRAFDAERRIVPHRRYPFAELQHRAGHERLLETALNVTHFHVYEQVPKEGFAVDTLAGGRELEETSFALLATFGIDPSGRNLQLLLQGNRAELTDEQMERLALSYAAVLQAMAADASAPHSAACLLAPDERHQLLSEWNDTRTDRPEEQVLHRLIERRASAAPDGPAVFADDREISCRQLDRSANRLARLLRESGAGPEARIAVFAERSIELVVGLLAVLKSGGAYVPVDPSYPAERIAFMIEDSRAPIVLTQERLVPLLPARGEGGPRVLRLDRPEESGEGFSDEPLDVEVQPDHPAYVIYTSGSTGRPKGAINTHRAIVNRLLWMQEAFGLTPADRVLQKTPYSFDVSVWEFFWPLLVGAPIVMARPGGHQDAAYLCRTIREHRVTTVHFVPSMLRIFLDEPEVGGLPTLRRVVASGEALPLDLVRRFAERTAGRVELHNLYGPTEAAVDVTWWPCREESPASSVPIGRPIANLRLHVLDAHGWPAPVGVPGELHIGGVGLARGYLERPALTAERFVPDPTAGAASGERLYRTGDLSRLLPDGSIEFLGRLDHQVKLHGVRIELGEIEAALCDLPEVREAAVLAREDAPGDQRLVAYLAWADPAAAPAPSALRPALRQRLPESMVPGTFVVLPVLPLSPNGKVDRRALPAPSGERGEERPYVAPRNRVEEVLAASWAEVLRLDRVGVLDNFFALGGDSMRVLQALNRARRAGLSFALQQVYEHETLGALAAAIARDDGGEAGLSPDLAAGFGERAEGARPEVSTQPFELVAEADRERLPQGLEDAYPLTWLQMGMLFHMEMTPDYPLYHDVDTSHLRVRFEPEPFRRAVARVVARHPVLRTSFDLASYSEPLQLVHREAEAEIGVHDLSELSAAEQEDALWRFVEAEKRRLFDLSLPPLIRFHVHVRGPGSCQFTLTKSHPILDGWSLQTTLLEILALYAAFLRGEEPAVEPPLGEGFRDFVALERQARDTPEQREFWERKLAGAPALRIARWPQEARPGESPYRAIQVPLGARFGDLRRIARTAQVPLKSVFLAAHAKVLSLIGAERDVVAGLTVHGRLEGPESANVRGLFLNTLPLRLDLSGGTWRELVRAAFDAERELLPYRRFPFAEIQRWRGREPLLETSLNVTHFEGREAGGEGGSAFALSTLGGRELEEKNFTLSAAFDIDPAGVRLQLVLHADRREIGDPQQDAIARYYLAALDALVGGFEERHDRAWLLAESERRQLLGEWNDTRVVRADDAVPLHRLIERRVALDPDAPAVEFDDERIDYRELDRRASGLARRLAAAGVGPEVRVAVFAERSIGLVVALYAVLKAGGAYLPIDPSYPEERIAFMLDDSGAPVVLAERRLRGRLPEGSPARVLDLDAPEPEGDEAPAGFEPVEVLPDHPAYVIYTSGSTGRPKGAVNTHRAIVNRLLWMQEAYGLDPDDRVLQKTPYGFDVSVWEFFWPLLVGARIVVARPGGHQDPTYLRRLICERGVTTVHFVPSMLQIFLEEPEVGACAASLRRTIASGEALPRDLARRFAERLGPVELHNLYGPTEAAVDVSAWDCATPSLAASVPIGRPIANLYLHVLDPGGLPAPVGVPGELHIGGVGLARGYLLRPALTAERFVPDATPGARAGTRLYRTGDLARWLPSGTLEFLGRLDHQVKLHGLRIELGEIEAALASTAGVREAAVVVREDAPGDRRLVAYVVASEPGAAPAALLRTALRERLPESMVPATFVTLDALPLSPNGKVDRRALPAPSGEREAGRPYVPPRNLIEEALAASWSEVLRVDRVGADDNFFALGGDSMRALQALNRARRAGVRHTLQQVYENETLAELAAAVARDGGSEELADRDLASRFGEAEAEPIVLTRPFELISEADRALVPDDVEDAYPLSRLQAGMLFHLELTPEYPLYLNVDTMHLRVQFDERAIRRAIGRVVDRHPILRTSFDLARYGEPMQEVHREAEPEIVVTDVRDLSAAEQEREIWDFVDAEKRRRFDLARAPLIRFHIHVRGEDDLQFTLAEFHPIQDGWSLQSTLVEILGLYAAFLRGEEPPVEPPLLATYRDFVALERRALEAPEHGEFWQRRLDGAVALRLPRWPRRLREGGAPFRTRHLPLADRYAGLRSLARATGVPLKSVFLAAHAKVLSLASGEIDVTTGLSSHGRLEGAQADQVRGLFLNAVPLRLDLSGGAWSDLIRAAFSAERELMPHRRFPFAEIQRRWGRGTLLETGLNVTQFHVYEGAEEKASLRVSSLAGRELEETNFTLSASFGIDPLGTRAVIVLTADRREICDPQYESIARSYFAVIDAMVADSEARHDAAWLIGAAARSQLLFEWNDTRVEREPIATLHGLFERHACRAPDSIAVAGPGVSLSAGELDRRAERLAAHLRRRGVGVDDIVALCGARTPEVVVGALAILKAGGAFLPLDPSHPVERLLYVFEDSGARVGLVEPGLLASLPEEVRSRCLPLAPEASVEGDPAAAPAPPAPAVDGANLAYVIYTSGTTGRPKGALLTHAAIRDRVEALASDWLLRPGKRIAQVATFAFDGAVIEVWAALASGAELHFFPEEAHLPGPALVRELREREITALVMSPSALGALGSPALPALDVVMAAGEACPPEVTEVWSRGRRFMNGYGPTEVTIGAARAFGPSPFDRPPIGRPLPNTRVLVLDRQGLPAAVGVPGEICVAGIGLGRGYLGRPALSAERFVPNPWSEAGGERLYRTGDLGRWLPTGELDFVGRIDHQVKVRGFRVELGEVEAALSRQAGVREVAVVAKPGGVGGLRLVAYVEIEGPSEAPATTVPALRAALRAELPEFMVPAGWALLAALPKTPSGKIDRNVLPEAEDSFTTSYSPPRDELEQLLTAMWGEELGVERVGIDDNIFDLGGHSLLMIRLQARLVDLGFEVSVTDLFQYPNVKALAGFLGRNLLTSSSEEGQDRGESRRKRAAEREDQRERRRSARRDERAT